MAQQRTSLQIVHCSKHKNLVHMEMGLCWTLENHLQTFSKVTTRPHAALFHINPIGTWLQSSDPVGALQFWLNRKPWRFSSIFLTECLLSLLLPPGCCFAWTELTVWLFELYSCCFLKPDRCWFQLTGNADSYIHSPCSVSTVRTTRFDIMRNFYP